MSGWSCTLQALVRTIKVLNRALSNILYVSQDIAFPLSKHVVLHELVNLLVASMLISMRVRRVYAELRRHNEANASALNRSLSA